MSYEHKFCFINPQGCFTALSLFSNLYLTGRLGYKAALITIHEPVENYVIEKKTRQWKGGERIKGGVCEWVYEALAHTMVRWSWV